MTGVRGDQRVSVPIRVIGAVHQSGVRAERAEFLRRGVYHRFIVVVLALAVVLSVASGDRWVTVVICAALMLVEICLIARDMHEFHRSAAMSDRMADLVNQYQNDGTLLPWPEEEGTP